MKNIFLVLFTTVYASILNAGPISSGGGGVFVCRNNENRITSVEMIDLWEIQNIAGYRVLESNEAPEIQISKALDKLGKLAPTFAEDIRKEIESQKKMFKPLQPGVRLLPPNDIATPYRKDGCDIAGMMYYDNTYNRISYDAEYFSHLSSNTQIAAAYLHEAIYKILRQAPNNNVNSVLTRTIVGDILSEYNFLNPVSPLITIRNIFDRIPDVAGTEAPIPASVLECHSADGLYNGLTHTAFYYVMYKNRKWPELIFKRFEWMDLTNTYVSVINNNRVEDGFAVHIRYLQFSLYPDLNNGDFLSFTAGLLRRFSLDPVTLTGSYELETLERYGQFQENFSCREINRP